MDSKISSHFDLMQEDRKWQDASNVKDSVTNCYKKKIHDPIYFFVHNDKHTTEKITRPDSSFQRTVSMSGENPLIQNHLLNASVRDNRGQ